MGSKKGRLLLGDAFGRAVVTWRIAEALRVEAVGRPPPELTVEDDTLPAWDDLVERWQDGNTEAWQVKSSSNLALADLTKLVTHLASDSSIRRATIAVRGAGMVAGADVSLASLDECLAKVHSGATPATDSRPWRLLRELAGSAPAALELGRRLHLLFVANIEQPVTLARAALESVYEVGAVDEVLGAIRSALEMAPAASFRVGDLRCTVLRKYEIVRLGTLPGVGASARSAYLEALVSAMRSRRILRDLAQHGFPMADLWVPPVCSTQTGERFSGETIITRIVPSDLHFLVAPAGAGKTELLARIARDLAEAAFDDVGAPVPLFLSITNINELNHEQLRVASEKAAPGTGDALRQLLPTCRRWWLLVDGVDESPHGIERLEALRTWFPVDAVIASTRPGPERACPSAQVFRIERWTTSDIERFVEAFDRVSPGSGAQIRGAPFDVTALFELPLTATLAMLVVATGRKLPKSRTLLFQAAIEVLVQAWTARRHDAPQWNAFAPEIRRFALECARQLRTTISLDELPSVVRRVSRDGSVALGNSIRHDFGLLVPVASTTGGEFEFLVRGIAEYLAAEALMNDDAAILSAAANAWGSEVARHAISLREDECAGACERFLIQLVKADDGPAEIPGLRRRLVAIGAVADIREAPPIVENCIVRTCLAELCDENSPWRADVFSRAVAEFARASPRCWGALRDEIRARLSDPRVPLQYFCALQDLGTEAWIVTLLHCDPEVRAEAIRRLSPALSTNEQACMATLIMLRDAMPSGHFGCVPAIEAGLALRKAPREGEVPAALEVARTLARTEAQLISAAAAVSLRPDEDDPEVLALALRRGGDAAVVPVEVVRELGATAIGGAALGRLWPNWPSYEPFPRHSLLSPADGESQPPSALTRRRLSSLLLVDLRCEKGQEQLHERLALLASMGNAGDLALEFACEHGLQHPDLLARILDGPPDTFPALSLEAQDWLGRAAMQHSGIRDLLLSKWEEFERDAAWRVGGYPGRALEALVISSDSSAAAVYARWLEHSPYTNGCFYNGPIPDPRVFDNERVAKAADQVVIGLLEYATLGRVDRDGSRQLLAPLSAAGALMNFAPRWRTNEAIIGQLLTWLDDDDVNTRNGSARALRVAQLGAAARERLVIALRRQLNEETRTRSFSTRSIIQLAQAQGMLMELAADLDRVLGARGWDSVLAACALCIVLPGPEATVRSSAASRLPFSHHTIDRIDASELAWMVHFAPDEWEHAVIAHVEQLGGEYLGVVIPVFDALPPQHRRHCASVLVRLPELGLLPWCMTDHFEPPYRPRERLLQLLFSVGLDDAPTSA